MRNFYIDTLNSNLQIHDSQNPSIGYWLQPAIEGLDTPEYRSNEYNKPGENGSVVSSMFYGSRIVSLRGIINGTSPADYEAKRQAFAVATSIKKDADGSPIPMRCQFTTLGGQTYFFDAYPRKPMFSYDNISWTKFIFQMVVPAPFLFGNTIVSSGAVMRASGGGLILPFILPIISTTSTGGMVALNNVGNADSPPIITFTGPLTNPQLSNTTVGKTIGLTYSILSGSTVTIDMLEKTIMLNGTQSIESAKTSDSDWWYMEPGINNLTFNTDSSSDTGSAFIEFYNAYLGA